MNLLPQTQRSVSSEKLRGTFGRLDCTYHNFGKESSEGSGAESRPPNLGTSSGVETRVGGTVAFLKPHNRTQCTRERGTVLGITLHGRRATAHRKYDSDRTSADIDTMAVRDGKR